jgi:hypothetical protein
VRTTTLLVTADQPAVIRVKEEDPRLDPLAIEFVDRRTQSLQRVPGARVDHYRQTSTSFWHLMMGHGLGKELGWQVVDDGVSEVLEDLGSG